MADRKLFGTDGIRGVANVHPMTTEVAMKLGQALAFVLRQHHPRPRIVIGKDTRLSGYMLENAISSGICSMGADVLLVGPLPTPGIAFITRSMRAQAGVVISASHNPFQDNGIKVFSGDGYKLDDDLEAQIETLIFGNEYPGFEVTASEVGKAFRIDDAAGRYIVYLKQAFPHDMTLDGLSIAVDCAHGAAYRVAPSVFEELGAVVTVIGDKPNGTNINKACGALHPSRVARLVANRGLDFGVALDGDADRAIMVDETGEVVDGDRVMALCAKDMMDRGVLRKNTVVATVMSNLGLEKALKKMGVELIRTKVGDRYVVEKMRSHGYCLGGEQSGHTIFRDFSTTGDGILSTLQVLSVIGRSGKPLSELSGVMKTYPQVLVNFKVKSKPPLDQLPRLAGAIKAVDEELGGQGRVLVRYSGTEAKMRVMVEGADQAQIEKLAENLAELARQEIAEQ